MQRRRFFGPVRLFIIVVSGIALKASIAASQPAAKPNLVGFSVSAAPIYQSKADLDRGGQFSLGHYQLRWAATRSLSNAARLGFSVEYDYLDFDFSKPAAFAGAEPWNDIHRIGFGLPVFYRLNNNWQVFISPSIDWAAESGADFSEALRFGAVFSAVHRFSSNFSLGAGIGVFYGLEEANFFPYIALYLKVSEKWLLTNPFSAGPVGPAGLELIYLPDGLWEIGGGGAYRSNRFRLDGKGVAPDGIGQSSGLPAWIRITRRLGRYYKLDFYGGVLFNAELRMEDRDGHKLGSDDLGPAAFMAVNISARF